jgi:prepilin-type N-terminal cleavage/methylation domain-containing protein
MSAWNDKHFLISVKSVLGKSCSDHSGFSLAEVLAALTIGAMILVAVLGVYSGVEGAAGAITRKLDNSRLPSEVLQRIAEDLDRIIAPVSDAKAADTKITIENKLINLYPSARLTIVRTIYDSKDKKQTFEEIVWQANYDFDTDSLILYRSQSGMGLEDKLLDAERASWEKDYSFVPICSGVTFFKVQVPKGDDFEDSWTSDSLPPGIVATISFGEPFKTVTGPLDVPEEAKITRTIAVDRTRKIKFAFAKKEVPEEDKDEQGDDEGDEEREEEEGEPGDSSRILQDSNE